MNLRNATIRIVLAIVSVIAIGGLIASCSTEEYEEFGTRKTLATRSGNNNVEHIVEGGYKTTEMKGGDSVSFYVKAAWTPGWLNYYPQATISAKASDVTLRIFKYKKRVDPLNYTESHCPPYFKVSPSAVWVSSICVYQLGLEYEIVIPDTVIGGEEILDTIKGKCTDVQEDVPNEYLSHYSI